MNYAAAEVNGRMKRVVAEKTSRICIFYLASYIDKLSETAFTGKMSSNETLITGQQSSKNCRVTCRLLITHSLAFKTR